MSKKISTQDLTDAGFFIVMQMLHVTYDEDMDSDKKQEIQRILKIIDLLVYAELDNRINAKKH